VQFDREVYNFFSRILGNLIAVTNIRMDVHCENVRTLNVNVGIMGHVDCGKTSLGALFHPFLNFLLVYFLSRQPFTARAISTHFSTASLDKHPQSIERGITIDLGFSSFMAPVEGSLFTLPYDQIQFTIVDCPGHASLIRTVLGGAHIIDIMLLVGRILHLFCLFLFVSLMNHFFHTIFLMSVRR
jgi:translation elongation factor EF-Tu-like GTPase